jgi:hypothetical protein
VSCECVQGGRRKTTNHPDEWKMYVTAAAEKIIASRYYFFVAKEKSYKLNNA